MAESSTLSVPALLSPAFCCSGSSRRATGPTDLRTTASQAPYLLPPREIIHTLRWKAVPSASRFEQHVVPENELFMNRPYSLLVNRVCEAKTSFVGVSCATSSVRHGASCFAGYGAVSLNRI
jgi:hypothetical protein